MPNIGNAKTKAECLALLFEMTLTPHGCTLPTCIQSHATTERKETIEGFLKIHCSDAMALESLHATAALLKLLAQIDCSASKIGKLDWLEEVEP